MNFPQALDAMQQGKCVSHNEGASSICLQQPSEAAGITRPYFTEQTADGHIVPWNPTQAALLATTWRVVKATLARAAIVALKPARAARAKARAKAGARQLQPA